MHLYMSTQSQFPKLKHVQFHLESFSLDFWIITFRFNSHIKIFCHTDLISRIQNFSQYLFSFPSLLVLVVRPISPENWVTSFFLSFTIEISVRALFFLFSFFESCVTAFVYPIDFTNIRYDEPLSPETWVGVKCFVFARPFIKWTIPKNTYIVILVVILSSRDSLAYSCNTTAFYQEQYFQGYQTSSGVIINNL